MLLKFKAVSPEILTFWPFLPGRPLVPCSPFGPYNKTIEIQSASGNTISVRKYNQRQKIQSASGNTISVRKYNQRQEIQWKGIIHMALKQVLLIKRFHVDVFWWSLIHWSIISLYMCNQWQESTLFYLTYCSDFQSINLKLDISCIQ